MENNCIPKVIVNKRNIIGEGVLWHPDKSCVYWVDIPKAKIFQYIPATGVIREWETEFPVGGFTIHEDGRLLLFMFEGAVGLWMDGEFEIIIKSLPTMKQNRFNDVVADPVGRVFCGVMSTKSTKGWVYRMNTDKTFTKVINNTGTANGMAFSKNEKKLFFCDSKKSSVSVFDYEKKTGEISNRKILLQTLRSESGSSDGLCIDSNDNIWVGRWDGSSIVQIDQNGCELQKIQFPTKKITTLCFGGKYLNDIYINSAGGDDLHQNGQLAGSLFQLRLGIKGKYEYRSHFDS